MNSYTHAPRIDSPTSMNLPDLIEIVEPEPQDCSTDSLPPEGNVKLRNYRTMNENLRTYTPTGDFNTSLEKGKFMAKFDVTTSISPPRAKILELLRPEDPGCDALEAIVRPASRRGLIRPLDEDTRRFLQRTLQTPTPQISDAPTQEPYALANDLRDESASQYHSTLTVPSSNRLSASPTIFTESLSPYRYLPVQNPLKPNLNKERSLAEELKEAEEEEQFRQCNAGNIRQELLREFRKQVEIGDSVERERLGKLALMVEEDDDRELGGLTVAARRLDALLAESRDLHEELAGIHEDIQTQSARACRCAAAARELRAQSRALSYLDDVVALLKGDVAAALRTKTWPFALGRREPGKNYVV